MIKLPTMIPDNTYWIFRFAEDIEVMPGPHPMTIDGFSADVYHLSNGGRIVLRRIGRDLLEISAPGYDIADNGIEIVRDVTTLTLVRRP